MKEILSSFGSEFLRPLLTLFLPGALGCTPLAVCVLSRFKDLRDYAAADHAEAIATFALTSTFLGFIFDSLGSQVEDRWDGAAGEEHRENWYLYLRLAFEKEPVGHRYLRTVLLHLKFELGCFVACVVAIPSIAFCPGSLWTRLGLIVFAGAGAVYFYRDGHDSHKLLGDIRKELLRGLNPSPKVRSAAATQSQSS